MVSIQNKIKLQPEIYIINFLERQDPGSVASILKKKDLCASLVAQYNVIAGIGNFTISCSLTMNGLKNLHDIMKLIFQVRDTRITVYSNYM